MTRIVVDSSVVIKWFVAEAYSTEAGRILDDYQKKNLELLAPDLLNAEIGSIVWKKQLFQGLAAADAEKILDAFALLTFQFTPTANLLKEAYSLAIAHQRSVYDALYLALSLRETCPLVTADQKLVNAISAQFSNVISVVSWP